jgi:hypothetical protein
LKINKDDYIRTKDGIIDKVIIEYNGECNSPNCNCKHVSCEHDYYDEDTIIKSSQNIIDLIRKNKDYVNGKLLDEGEYEFYKTYPVYIKSVVTKEQFEQMEYKVED